MLSRWMEWEAGELPPGDLIKHLKLAGFRELIQDIVSGIETTTEAATGETIGDLLG